MDVRIFSSVQLSLDSQGNNLYETGMAAYLATQG